jgi:hypothetical protein
MWRLRRARKLESAQSHLVGIGIHVAYQSDFPCHYEESSAGRAPSKPSGAMNSACDATCIKLLNS